MGLQRFERRLERLVEGGFGKAFRSGLQPVEIGRRLVREMDVGRTLGVRGTIVPNDFVVSVSEADFERFEGFRETLVSELCETARDQARESGYHFTGPVRVALALDPGARTGDLVIEASIIAGPAGANGALVLPDDRRIQLGEDPVRIGRLPDCAIPLSDSQVSRHHAEVHRSDHGFSIVDLGSLNGTTVNGVVVQEKDLHDGDVITIGETAIRYEES
jgi:FhaA, N-terminal domain/FHA domain